MTLAERELTSAPVPHRWTVEDYLRASEAGAFGSQRVELIEGEIIDLPSQKDPHAWAISRLVKALLPVFPEPYWIKIQATLRLNDISAPEPDIVVMSGPPKPPARKAPKPLLIVEVSEATLSYDRGRKASLHAANGISDYWVADVIGKRVHVFREPRRDAEGRFGWKYRKTGSFTLGDIVSPLAKPDAKIAISAFLD